MHDKDKIPSDIETSVDEDSQDHVQEKETATAADIYEEMLESTAKKRDEYYDLLLRKQAEFENFRKRTDKVRADAYFQAQSEIVLELLPILDACEKGLETMSSKDSDQGLRPYKEGYRFFLEQMNLVLEKFQIKPVCGVGTQFDPNIHEAVLQEFTQEQDEGTILEVFRKGYLIKNKLLRAAQVKVAMSSANKDSHDNAAPSV